MNESMQRTIRGIRTSRGYTQKEMSDRLHVHETYWSHYERGERRPSLTLIARMRRYIDLTDDEVLDLVAAAMDDDDEKEQKYDAGDDIPVQEPSGGPEMGKRGEANSINQAGWTLRERLAARNAHRRGR